MQIGLPVLTSNVTAAREVVRNGVDGLHLPPGDTDAWSAGMSMLRDCETVRRFSLSSFDRSLGFLDHEEYLLRLLSIYERSARMQLEQRQH
jgi:glycosyltransferase involved in cell wall biosynthesis